MAFETISGFETKFFVVAGYLQHQQEIFLARVVRSVTNVTIDWS